MQASIQKIKYTNIGLPIYIIFGDFYEKQFGDFTFNCAIHNKSTRHRGNLHVLQSHLTIRQKGVCYMSVKFLTVCLPF